VALAALPTTTFATALPLTDSGVLTIANMGGTLVGVTTSPTTCINWSGATTCSPATQHQYTVSGVSNLFSTSASGNDLISDLPYLPPPTLVDFLQADGAGALAGQTVYFDLTAIPLTNGGAGFGDCTNNNANNSCSPPGSPFTLQENSTATDVTITFSVQLLAYTCPSGGPPTCNASNTSFTPYVGTFSTDQALTVNGSGACSGVPATISNILICESNSGTIAASWSATLAPAPVPEPLSFVLFGSGLVAVSLFGRKLRRRS
jgi:hypothetical protein